MALLDIKKIRLDGGTQIRVKRHEDAVADYTDAYIEDVRMPPVEVIFDGADYWLWDGFHRVEAAVAAGKKGIAVNIVRGTLREAIEKAIGANSQHGIRRSNDDKLNAVKTMLGDAEWAALSDREIAKRCGVSNNMVSQRRNGSETTVKAARVSSDDTPAGKKSNKINDTRGVTPSSESVSENGQSAPGPVRVIKPKTEVAGNVVELVRERDEFATKNAELAFYLNDTMEELRVVKEGIALGDVVAAMATENTKLRKRIGELEDAINGLQEEKNAAVRQAKSWRAKAGR